MTATVLPARAARKGRPFFAAAVGLVAVVCLALASGASAGAETAQGYRLAGIVAVGKDYLGFLELPGGKQVLVRQGNVVEGGGRILLLDGERLRIGLPSGVIELELKGSGRPVAIPAAVAAADASEAAPPNQDQTLIRRVERKRLGAELRTPTGADEARATPQAAVTLRLASALDLPLHSKVVAVNDRPVTTVEAAIAGVERSLARNIAATLTVADAMGGPGTRVYIMPEPK